MTNSEVKSIIDGKTMPSYGDKICGSIYGERRLGDGTRSFPNGMTFHWESYNGRVDYVAYQNHLPKGIVWNQSGSRQFIKGPKWTLEYKDPDYETRFDEYKSEFVVPEFLEEEIQARGIPYYKAQEAFTHTFCLHILAKDL